VALTQEEIVQRAVRLLDEVGLEGLTLRRLAGELGVSAPTLYWHVRDKRQLLDLVAEAIVAGQRPPVRPAPGQPWWEWLADSAWAQYRALVSHRDAAQVVAGNRPTEASLPAIDRTLGSLVDVGFPPREALESVLALGHFVVGCAVERQAEAVRGPATERDAALALRLRDAEALPHLAAAAAAMPSPEVDSTVRHGVALIVAGMRARHAELTSAVVASPGRG
jgi:TetR/AcrR family tetracycline transcriptional repressor